MWAQTLGCVSAGRHMQVEWVNPELMIIDYQAELAVVRFEL